MDDAVVLLVEAVGKGGGGPADEEGGGPVAIDDRLVDVLVGTDGRPAVVR